MFNAFRQFDAHHTLDPEGRIGLAHAVLRSHAADGFEVHRRRTSQRPDEPIQRGHRFSDDRYRQRLWQWSTRAAEADRVPDRSFFYLLAATAFLTARHTARCFLHSLSGCFDQARQSSFDGGINPPI